MSHGRVQLDQVENTEELGAVISSVADPIERRDAAVITGPPRH